MPAPCCGARFFHASTLLIMLGVLLPASTSASMSVVPGGSANGETSAAVAACDHAGFRSGESTSRSSFPVTLQHEIQQKQNAS